MDLIDTLGDLWGLLGLVLKTYFVKVAIPVEWGPHTGPSGSGMDAPEEP